MIDDKIDLFFLIILKFVGICMCYYGFGVVDCFRCLGDLLDVIGVNINNGGICEKSDCLNVIIFGDMFLDILLLICKMIYFGVYINLFLLFINY